MIGALMFPGLSFRFKQVNFEGDPRRRGEMLRAARTLLNDKGMGLMFLVLPLACLDNSRYLNHVCLFHAITCTLTTTHKYANTSSD